MPQLPAKLAKRLVADGPALAPAPSPSPASVLDDVVTADGIAPMELRDGRMEWDVVRLRVCERRLAIPPVGESSGDGMRDPTSAPGMPIVSEPPEPDPEPEEGVDSSVGSACSEIAVVGIALAAAPVETPKGILPPEKRDEVEPRDARDPGRSGDGWAGKWLFWGCDPVLGRVGEAGGAGGETVGEVSGDGFVFSDGVGGRGSERSSVSVADAAGCSAGPACARRRESEDGPAVGEELARPRGKRRDVGGRVALNDSSTSGSGGPIGMGAEASAAGVNWGDVSDRGSTTGIFLVDSRRFEEYGGWVQSSTSSM